MIMYRAIVDSVSGTKVLAGGKWLTCIGNKNVKAGDFIWTDGRCVYGNFQDAQSPIVITPDEDWIIPIVVYDKTDSKQTGVFSFVENSLEYVAKTVKYNGQFVNTKSDSYGITGEAVNIKNDTIYKITIDDNKESKTKAVVVKKNNEIIFTVDLIKFMKENAENNITPLPSDVDYFNGNLFGFGSNDNIEDSGTITRIETYTSYGFSNGMAFIENENNWWFNIDIDYYNTIDKKTLIGVDDNKMLNEGIRYSYNNTFYFDSSGKRERISNTTVYEFYDVTEDILNRSVSVRNYEKLKEIKFMLQDGYYFYMTDFWFFTGYGGYPELAKYEVYSPSDKLIFSDWFKAGTHLAIYELHLGFLVGVGRARPGNRASYYEIFDEMYKAYVTTEEIEMAQDRLTMPDFIDEGIYIFREDKFLKIDEEIDEEIKTSACKNQFFRPMKKYKYWYNNIQNLE